MTRAPSLLPAEQVDEYLDRIGEVRPAAADTETLLRLHRAHLRTVPFENLDIHLDVPIELDIDALFDKIVRRRRGGFCYELNGLFAALLQSLGCGVELLEARVAVDDQAVGIPFDHLCLRVTPDGPDPIALLVDVGYGSSFPSTPLQLADVRPQEADNSSFTIAAVDFTVDADPPIEGAWWVLRRDGRPLYLFSQRPRLLADFTPGSQHHQHSPASHFTHGTVCSLLTSAGRLTVTGRTLKSTVDGAATSHTFGDERELGATLHEEFGIHVSDPEIELLWIRSTPSGVSTAVADRQ